MQAIYFKELRSYLSSLVAYIVIVVFLTGIGLFMWVFPGYNVLDYGFADMETLFAMGPYMFLFLIPAITMRSFAEEKKSGTMEFLFTHPLSDWDIILGKYLSSLTLVIFSLLPTLLYYYSVYQLGSPKGNIDSAGTTGSYIGLVLLGAVFTAIGIFASSLTSEQVTSFILALLLCFLFFFGFNLIAYIDDSSFLSYFLLQCGIDYHYASMRKGLIDSRDLVYFFSVIVLMLLATKFVLGMRKW